MGIQFTTADWSAYGPGEGFVATFKAVFVFYLIILENSGKNSN